MKKKIINGLLIAVVLVAATSSFVSCKDYDADNYNELQAKYLSLQDAFNKQVAAMKDYVLTSRYDSETGYSAAELAAKGTIKKRLDDLESEYSTLNGKFNDELDPTKVGSLAYQIAQNNIAIATAQGLASSAKALAERDSAYLRSLLAGWDNGGTLGDMVSEAAGLLTALKSDTAKYNFAYDTLSTYYQKWNEAVKLANEASSFIGASNKVKVLGNEVTSLQDMANAYNDAVADLYDKIAALRADVDNILATLQKEVTGIEIQATYNPIFGTFSYPIGVQSNILGAYYGICGVDVVKFPASDATQAQIASWATKAPVITRDELEAIYDGEYFIREKDAVLMVEGEGNAGKLYLTVNPSNVDFEKASFTLRASDNTISKVQLSPLTASTEQLKWGYNRAAADNSPNGFYVATAEIKKESVNDVALSFNLKGMAKQIQSMMNDWSSTNASDLAKLALTIHDGLKTDVPRLGVQYQWKDATSENPWKNYVSKYDIAAVSVKPLGFDFLLTENEDGTVVPMDFSKGIFKFKNKLTAKEKAFEMELLQEIADMIHVVIPYPVDGTNIKTIIDGDGTTHVYIFIKNGDLGSVTPSIKINNGAIYDNGYGFLIPDDPAGYIILTGTKVSLPNVADTDGYYMDITPLYAAIKKGIEDAINSINGKAAGTIDKYVQKVINVQNKIFGKVESVAKNLNRYVQPALMGKCDQLGFFYPSRDFLAPTQVKRGQKIMLYPTTLTGEVVAPAFKKYVAVCGAWDVNNIYDTKPAKDFNTGALNTVFNGADYNMSNPIEYTVDAPAGTVLEFIYECLGYNGKVAGKKYYIEVYE